MKCVRVGRSDKTETADKTLDVQSAFASYARACADVGVVIRTLVGEMSYEANIPRGYEPYCRNLFGLGSQFLSLRGGA